MIELSPGSPSFCLTLPPWVQQIAQPGAMFPRREERMRLVIELAAEDVRRRTGGPFGAGVFERETGRLVAAGVNLVVPTACSIAHAEAVALILAQQARKSHDLSAPGSPPVELVSSAQPCCQCFGIV
jgi:tRNA(Arg) A34 adenosine deaminase TadA